MLRACFLYNKMLRLKAQKMTIGSLFRQLNEKIDPECVVPKLCAFNTITQEQSELIFSRLGSTARNNKLLQIVQNVDSGISGLSEALKECNQKILAKKLRKQFNKYLKHLEIAKNRVKRSEMEQFFVFRTVTYTVA